MKGKRIPLKTREAMVTDYLAGLSTQAVATKYGVSSNTAYHYISKAGAIRNLREAKAVERDLEHRLAGGHWMPNRRGIQVWQPCFFNDAQTCNINHQENRHAA